MDTKTIFLILSTVLGFVTQIIGIVSILNGSFKPQRMTRFLYFLMNFLFVGTIIAQESWGALGLAGAQFIGNAIIFFLSIKYGMGGTTKSDFVVLGGAIISGIVWKITDDPTLALIMSITTDFIAFVPSYIKIWKHPETENWLFYCSDIFAGGFSILALASYSMGDLAFPLYIFVLNLTTTILILVRTEMIRKKI